MIFDLFHDHNDLINIVSISDIADKENLLYLLKYDTIYGKLDAEIETTDTGFKINGKNIVFNDWKDASEASWQDLETDILIVSTGRKQDHAQMSNTKRKRHRK